MAKKAQKRTSRPRSAGDIAKMSDDALLATPIKALKLSLDATWVRACLRDLDKELQGRNILVRPHAWISDEWFSPPQTPGIAIPFYLAHPRLLRLERKMMLEAEGGTRADCMRLLRHEMGHVVQYAFGLHRRRQWQKLFGRATTPYPDHYRADPNSRRHVQHLRRWYAQCHPDEDFAETFAVWMTPRANWRKRYADWPALEKLEYVDALMQEIAGEKPALRKRVQVEPLAALKGTLGEHYEKKRERYAIDSPSVFDRDLRRLFSDDPRHARAPQAASVIRRNRAQIIRSVSRWTGEYPLALDSALDDMIARCRTLNLRARGSDQSVRTELAAMLSSKAAFTQYSASRRQWFAV